MILDGAEKGALRITEAKTTRGVVAGVSAVGHWTCELPYYHLERGARYSAFFVSLLLA